MMNMVTVFLDAGVIAGELLAGKLAGDALRPRVEQWAGTVPLGSTLVLDLGRVQLLTSSYFLAAFAWLWTSVETLRRELYPVLVNLNDETQEELKIAIEARGLKVLCGHSQDEVLLNMRPLNIDAIELETYKRIEELGEVTAGDLFRVDPRTQPTAWSNRLAQLYGYRLIRRRKEGRQVIYSLVWR